MQIDWFTVAAEIVNFLILLFLLKYFLYDRIIGVAEAREEQIANRFAEAEERQEEAEQQAKEVRQQRQEIEEKRKRLLEEARAEAEERRRELLQEARTAVDQQQKEWQDALKREQERFLHRLQQRVGQQVYAIAERALADLANADLEQQVIEVFLGRLRQLDQEKQTAILDALQESEARVHTAFPLSDSHQQEIITILQTELQENLSPHFNVDEELVCGISLRVDGHQVTWNIHSYLDHLEKQVQELLRTEKTEPEGGE